MLKNNIQKILLTQTKPILVLLKELLIYVCVYTREYRSVLTVFLLMLQTAFQVQKNFA